MELGKPPVLPCLPWALLVYDPIAGPKCPEEECLRDGGDLGPRAAFGPEGRLVGVDPADTVAEYVDNGGRRRITVSNPVCLCVPRFAVIRSVLLPSGYLTVVGPNRGTPSWNRS